MVGRDTVVVAVVIVVDIDESIVVDNYFVEDWVGKGNHLGIEYFS